MIPQNWGALHRTSPKWLGWLGHTGCASILEIVPKAAVDDEQNYVVLVLDSASVIKKSESRRPQRCRAQDRILPLATN